MNDKNAHATGKKNIPPAVRPFVDHLQETLPEFCTPSDLVEAGLFKTDSVLRGLRYRGLGPVYIRISPRNYRYPKKTVIDWVVAAAQASEPEQIIKNRQTKLRHAMALPTTR